MKRLVYIAFAPFLYLVVKITMKGFVLIAFSVNDVGHVRTSLVMSENVVDKIEFAIKLQ
jgi:hypothetical protein